MTPTVPATPDTASQLRHQARQATVDAALQLAPKAIAVLEEILNDADGAATPRNAAARTVLELGGLIGAGKEAVAAGRTARDMSLADLEAEIAKTKARLRVIDSEGG